ncbi:MAG TPA: hypothetical protein DFI63_04260 [Lachnospiraceae bacterium]|nr:hypothetical protein [Lachnospiraceae bacterium]
MKVKKVLFYAAPVALAGFLYIGEATGIGEVLAKTVKTVIKTETKGKWIRDISISFYSVDDKFIDEYYDENDTPYYKRYERITETEIQTEVPDDPQSSDVSVKVVPTVDPEAEAAQERARQEAIEKAREEAAVKVQKEAEQKTEDFVKEIAKITEQAIQASAKAGEANGEVAGTPTAVIKTDYFTCFTQEMLKQLASNPNVNYEIHYRYQGKRYVVVIPAGTDYSQLKDSNGYYGFRYLDSIFGGYEEGTK